MSLVPPQKLALHELHEKLTSEEVVHSIVGHAVELRASDLFFTAEERSVMVGCRQMGRVRPLRPFSTEFGRRMMNHVKAMAGIDLSERMRPTEGRWIYEAEGRTPIDLRVNCLPTIHGEDLAVRLLDREHGLIPLERYGFERREFEALTGLLRRKSGMVVVCGPTGCGKSTTLYSGLQYLNDGSRKINTLEDPVEYVVKGVRQSQVNPRIGIEFSDLLSACLRQSPDVIMIGEIRDASTAQTAVRAANSGHLVLATMHAPIAVKAIGAMVHLGVSRQALSEGLVGIVAQRLVRRLCDDCRQRIELPEVPEFLADLRHLLPDDWTPAIYAAKGCDACHGEGYVRPLCVPEIMPLDAELRTRIVAGAPLSELQQAARSPERVTFRESAMIRVARGLTTIEEVVRVIPFEDLIELDAEDWRLGLATRMESPRVDANVLPSPHLDFSAAGGSNGDPAGDAVSTRGHHEGATTGHGEGVEPASGG